MKFLIVSSIAMLAASSLLAQITPQQKALAKALNEYQENTAAFEELAARASAAGIPDPVVKTSRMILHLNRGDIASVRALLPEVDAARAEILAQQFFPISPEEFDQLIAKMRGLADRWSKDPATASETVAVTRKRAHLPRL